MLGLRRAKAVLICGKICCGKTTYAQKLCAKSNSVLLSVDEIMLAIFGQHCGEKHDEYAKKTQAYLFEKSLQFIEKGIDTVLDWGFWTAEGRAYAGKFYADRHIPCEIHYIDIDDDRRQKLIEKRNGEVTSKKTEAYFVDDNLAAKACAVFEAPDRSEIDVWIKEGENGYEIQA